MLALKVLGWIAKALVALLFAAFLYALWPPLFFIWIGILGFFLFIGILGMVVSASVKHALDQNREVQTK
jgi:hypothetical protein